MTLFNQVLASLRMMVNDMGVDEKFDTFIKKKTRLPTTQNIYYLAYDLDYGKFIMEHEISIPHNTIVIKRATIPPARDKKLEIVIEDYIFEWERKDRERNNN